MPERKHITEGLRCWCGPVVDAYGPSDGTPRAMSVGADSPRLPGVR